MAGTLLFVHGTGVREDGYRKVSDDVRLGAAEHGLGHVKLVAPAWGPDLRARFDDVTRALPPQVKTRDATGGPVITERDLEAATWDLLLGDPLFELRVYAQGPPADGPGVVVNAPLLQQDAIDMVLRLHAETLALDRTGLTAEELQASAGAVARADELAGAARAAGSAAHPDLIEAAARAVVATALAAHRFDPPGTAPVAALSGAVRTALVEDIRRAIAPDKTRGAPGWLKNKIAGFVLSRATAFVEERRAGLMGMATPAVGDILFYQRRSEELGGFIAKAIEGLARPVVAVGHSLGGVALVDLLSRDDRPTLDRLVTVGSQAPLFFAIDALGLLRPGEPERRPFTPWLNIYNRRDFLSFCAKKVFPKEREIQDQEVDPGVPFPESHSAYWNDDRTFQLIGKFWPS